MLEFDNIRFTGVPLVHNCEPAWSWSPAPLIDYDLWVVLGGNGRLALDGESHRLAAGAAFVFTPGARVNGLHDPADCLRVFAVHFDMPGDLVQSLCRTAPDVAYLAMLGRHCATAYRRGNKAEALLLVKLILLHVFGASNASPGMVDLPMQQLMDEIDENPGFAWSLAEMSGAVHLSRQQVTRRFAAAAGMAPMQYVIHARVERAKALLTNTSMSVSQVADALGYSDIYYFSRQFRKEAGIPPSEFRRGG